MRIRSALLAAAAGLSLGACGTSRQLPAYERPLAHTDFQRVRTTAYTHTEADHEEYGNRTALGGILHAAAPPFVPRAIPVAQPVFRGPASGYQPIAYISPSQPFAARNFSHPIYGWALAGRNTIDLYMASPSAMNNWGVREEMIQIVEWGDPGESLRRLAPHTKYRHLKRMVLELEGHDRAAANLD